MSWQETIEEGLGITTYDYITLIIFLAFAVILGFARDVRIGLVTAFVLQGLYYTVLYLMREEWQVPFDVQARALLALIAYAILLTLSIFVTYKRGDIRMV